MKGSIHEDKRFKLTNANNFDTTTSNTTNNTNNLLSVLPIQRLDSYSKGTKKLVMAAKERNIQLMLMPNGMTKRQLNKSRYNHKDNTIYWKVFIVFIINNQYTIDSLFRIDLESVQKASNLQLTIVDNSLIGL